MTETFTNKNGTFADGDEVWFRVENPSLWSGDTDGKLRHVNGEWVIETKRSGIVTINKGYDAYVNSICKPVKSHAEQIAESLVRQKQESEKR